MRRKQKAEAQPGSYQPREREVVPIPFEDLPDLKCGDKIVKIPLFAFNTEWRESHQDFINANLHRIDKSLEKPPNVKFLFDKYPNDDDKSGTKETNDAPIGEGVGGDGAADDGGNEADEEDEDREEDEEDEGIGASGWQGGSDDDDDDDGQPVKEQGEWLDLWERTIADLFQSQLTRYCSLNPLQRSPQSPPPSPAQCLPCRLISLRSKPPFLLFLDHTLSR